MKLRKENKLKRKRLDIIPNILSWISTIFLIISTIILWAYVGKTDTMILITALIGVLIMINISTLIVNKIYGKKIVESIPLLKHRLNKFLAKSIFFFGIGLSLFIDSWRNNFSDNLLQLYISVFLLLIGEIMYVHYAKRDTLIENHLIKKNNKKKK